MKVLSICYICDEEFTFCPFTQKNLRKTLHKKSVQKDFENGQVVEQTIYSEKIKVTICPPCEKENFKLQKEIEKRIKNKASNQ